MLVYPLSIMTNEKSKTLIPYLGKNHPLYKWKRHFKRTSKSIGQAIGMSSSCVRAVWNTGKAQEPTITKLHRHTNIPEEVLRYPGKHPDFNIKNCKPSDMPASVNC